MHGLFRLINHLAAKYADPEGNAEAQNNFREMYTSLGMMYEQGQGVPQNYIIAHMWVNLAASRATDTATRNQAAKNCNRTAAEMTPAQIAEATLRCGDAETSERATAKSLREEGSRDHPLKVRAGALA